MKQEPNVRAPRSPEPRSRIGLLRRPAFYLVACNLLFWGVPLTLVQLQGSRTIEVSAADPGLGSIPEAGPAVLPLSATSDEAGAPSLTSLPPLVVPYTEGAMPGVPVPMGQATRVTQGPAAIPALLKGEWSEPTGADAFPALNPLSQLQGADGLGGPITLATINEPRMPIAARAERLAQQRSGDPLAALPLHWREPLRRELGPRRAVTDVATVRLPVPAIKDRQEVPVIVKDTGEAEGLVLPRDPRIASAVETWAKRQPAPKPGTVQVVLVAAEPLEMAQQVEATTVAALPRPVTPATAKRLPPPPLPPLADAPP